MAQVDHSEPLRILHLEDSLADHRLTALTLQRSGVPAVLQHVDTLEAFGRALDAGPSDLILADYQLAGFTALDAWELAARMPQPPPFVLVSGAIGEAAAVDAIRLGISDYVLKDQLSRLPHVIGQARAMHKARAQSARAAAELAKSEERLALLTRHLQESIEEERAAISREIHDDIGGALAAARIDMAWIERHSTQPDVARHARAATDMLQHALGASQRILRNLRPPVLDQGLLAALDWLARDFEQRTGTAVQLSASLRSAGLPETTEIVAYRTVQEALTNVAKHAGARHVKIDLSDAEGVLTVEVDDDGQGMPASAPDTARSFGLAGLRERAKTVGGWLDLISRPGRGTCVILSVPLAAPSPEGEGSA